MNWSPVDSNGQDGPNPDPDRQPVIDPVDPVDPVSPDPVKIVIVKTANWPDELTQPRQWQPSNPVNEDRTDPAQTDQIVDPDPLWLVIIDYWPNWYYWPIGIVDRPDPIDRWLTQWSQPSYCDDESWTSQWASPGGWRTGPVLAMTTNWPSWPGGRWPRLVVTQLLNWQPDRPRRQPRPSGRTQTETDELVVEPSWWTDGPRRMTKANGPIVLTHWPRPIGQTQPSGDETRWTDGDQWTQLLTIMTQLTQLVSPAQKAGPRARPVEPSPANDNDDQTQPKPNW